ncbi:4-diphosphocytidyl-2-C-methyl-D-erythritol kinase [Polaromonas vacuolata]|uniref:4-diphosphocytidyl-2-C-methyl-D-erythritol kinase n=1 Tax=Polaromonas vacuolata TaxID=37448 RepID=A0A6H2HCB0_9BURK|nr:4-diphosphocytidyl-2-C-methyl-D-erythritol kinase [Polaromonas vacuolata]
MTKSPLRAIYDVPAPAKLNLFLHITGRRADGYHLMQSVFMLIDWCDTLHFELRQDGGISRSDIRGNGSIETLPEVDLCVRAAKALQIATACTLGVHITLEKRIPSQAGMGGGSSDAASCLLALQRLWGVALPRAELMALALKLGADVPFFLSGGHAWVEGIGELITPIELPTAHFLVIKPEAGLATQDIFTSPLLKRDSETDTLQGFATNSESQIYEFGRNDLQPVAKSLCPQLEQSLDFLAEMQLKGRMTGSGSAVFAKLTQKIEIPVLESTWKTKICVNLEKHPLAAW